MVIKVKEKNIHYTKTGTGNDVILLVHGWGGSSRSLSELQNLLSESFTVVCLDLPGFGPSDLPDSDWGVSEYSNFLIEFLSELGINKCIYVGHSFGGALGVYLSASNPEIISKLVLCAPSFRRDPSVVDKGKRVTKVFKSLHLPESQFLKKLYYKIFFPESDLPRFPQLESNFRKIVSEDLTPLLDKIPHETLILWGDLDTYVPISDAYILNKGIKNSKLIEYEGIGHKFPLSEPQRVCKDIREFIKI